MELYFAGPTKNQELAYPRGGKARSLNSLECRTARNGSLQRWIEQRVGAVVVTEEDSECLEVIAGDRKSAKQLIFTV
jgi:hypothetical protein